MTDPNEVVSMTIRLRAAQLAANIQANNRLMAMLDGYKPKPLTRLERFWIGFKVPFQRMRDAFLVLIGKAEIADPYEEY
jgi:hypothetical protein